MADQAEMRLLVNVYKKIRAYGQPQEIIFTHNILKRKKK
jgi:hypothetical protein